MAGMYIHIPFCRQRCHYCNFHFSTSFKQKDDMMAALVHEIELIKPFQDQGEIGTIYFGGGTPSMLEGGDLHRILDAVHKRFQVAPDAEITLEANPDDIVDEKLRHWKSIGINRFSLGIQSFNEEELTWMNRSHDSRQAIQSIGKIRDAGFTNFSVDLIYGSPLITDQQWKENVDRLIQEEVPHISCYALTVEPKTPLEAFIKKGIKQSTDPGKQAIQSLMLMKWLEDAGYDHYEISNFSQPGMRSKHNSSYWQGEAYYGIGPSAHSFDGGNRRRWNLAHNARYIQSLKEHLIPWEEEVLTPTQQCNEYIMTALRTKEGLDINFVTKKFGTRAGNELEQKIKQEMNKDLSQKLIFNERSVSLTREGKLFADGIASSLFFD
jgi:oxygen-independent coproporphyrinogen-3 oxidase